jgi:hypothetical protein
VLRRRRVRQRLLAVVAARVATIGGREGGQRDGAQDTFVPATGAPDPTGPPQM